MSIDGLTSPKLISAATYKRQSFAWTPEWLARHLFARRSDKLRQRFSPPLGTIGRLEVRLARDKPTIRRLQRLRYEIFYQQGRATADLVTRLVRRDVDSFDGICDHLMVVERHQPQSLFGRSPVVGTYRLLPQEIAERHGGFYSANEFDISDLLKRHSSQRFLELGRSCVLPSYRPRRTIELLWRGVWSYVIENRIDVMIGCASFEGADKEQLARSLSFLHHFARAPEQWRVVAHSSRRIEMNRLAESEIDVRRAWRELPPLIKGYLRAGAYVGDGAVFDPQFNTTDVFVVLPVARINTRYVRHFGRDLRR